MGGNPPSGGKGIPPGIAGMPWGPGGKGGKGMPLGRFGAEKFKVS